ncbi:MAG: Subtilisin E precursor [Syntrophorhabdus sp. PtaU1.Bin153]|nr:MAG: Subtilisin E precursor [Syntrophorhabdus sp. PtaU1.Bin153]
MKKVFLIGMFLAIFGFSTLANAQPAKGNEAKIVSPGGYKQLHSKAQSKGSVKILVRVRAPFTPESVLQEKDIHDQRVTISRIQNQLVTELERAGNKPAHVYKYNYAPYISMTVDSAALDTLLSSPDVISVEEDMPVPLTLDLSVPRIGATQLHTNSVTGAGVVVAILDTGVDRNHPFLQGAIISEACYSTNDSAYGSSSLCPGGVTESTAEGSAMPYGGNCPVGECSHGTHVAGIVAGRNGISGSPGPGVAPEAGVIAIQVCSRFDSESYCGTGQAPCVMSFLSDIIKGLERVYELRTTSLIASVNISLGGGGYSSYCDDYFPAVKASIDNLRSAGIATVIASGNDFYCGAISAPACISSAISVGATDDDDAVALYSNSASILSLLAPGSWINSSIPQADGGGYWSASGTSAAAPHVAGAWALMKQAYPTATVGDIVGRFTSTGLNVTDGGCPSVTKQRINVYEASNISPNTLLYADFGPAGTWMWNGSTWIRLTPSNPENMAASGLVLYGDFGPAGTWMGNGSIWSPLTPSNPENMVVSGSSLYGDFGPAGIWMHNESGWSPLTPSNPENMVASGLVLYGDFGPAGIWMHNESGWSPLTPSNPENMAVPPVGH